jgi:Cd2+/Zn2+-exporting ATPase
MPLAALSLYALSAGAGLLQVLPKAWAATRQWRPDMNTLVVVSAAGALVLGEWVEAATLSFLFALSGRLEGWSLERAREAIAKLLRVAPSRAAVQHKDHFHETLVENLREGMVVRVDGGARIPCDGTVIGGESRVDQALITGESVLIPKSPGAHVYAGTVNQEGTLIVRVDRRTGDTVLARMIRMVESSQARRARTEQMIERFAIRYTPAVFALALAVALTGPALAGGAWTAWAYRGMLVLLVACPCALVISTPVTTMAALTSAAREGVLVKGGAFLEEAAHLRVLLTTQPGPAPHGVELVRVDEHADAEARLEFLRAHVIHQPHVGYAGETLHDAEAIKEAPLGISLAGPGSGAVHEAADVVLMRGGLPGIGFLVAHARRARKIIAANIILAVALKMVFIGAAFLGHATLWMAVAADTGATLLVTLNGLRMLRAVKLKT